MEKLQILGVLAGILQIAGYWIYGRASLASDIKPNAASWAAWSFGSLINLISYASLTQGDWKKDALPAACSFCCLTMTVVLLLKGHMHKPREPWEWCAFVIDAVASLVFLATLGQPVFANTLVQVGTVASFVPVVRDTLSSPENEKPAPWVVWSLAYATLLLVVLLDRDSENTVAEALYPATCLALHSLVACLSTRKNKAASM